MLEIPQAPNEMFRTLRNSPMNGLVMKCKVSNGSSMSDDRIITSQVAKKSEVDGVVG